MLAISVLSAITDAMASLKPGKMPPLDAPATPEAIMRAVKAMRHEGLAPYRESTRSAWPCAMVSVVKVEGSAPREAGARIDREPSGFHGTIGGGALEWRALPRRRSHAGKPAQHIALASIALGPNSGNAAAGGCSADRSLRRATACRCPQARDAEILAPSRPKAACGPIISRAPSVRHPVAAGDLMIEQFRRSDRGRSISSARAMSAAPLSWRWRRCLSTIRWIDLATRCISRRRAGQCRAHSPLAIPWESWRMRPRAALLLVMTHSHALDLAIIDARAARGPVPLCRAYRQRHQTSPVR